MRKVILVMALAVAAFGYYYSITTGDNIGFLLMALGTAVFLFLCVAPPLHREQDYYDHNAE